MLPEDIKPRDFEGRRVRDHLNHERIEVVRGSWRVSSNDSRKFALWLTDGRTIYADAAGLLLGGWNFAD